MTRPGMSISRGKALLFSMLPLMLLILVLIGTEFLLRALSPADELALMHKARFDGIDWYETGRQALRVYFPAGTPSVPEFKTALFRREKSPRMFRLLCLGESTMFGTPYDMNANIPGIVRKQLRRLMPDREVEVINLGASAINSNVVRDLAPGMLAVQPDAVLLYLGHNEMYGPDGVGASWLEKQWPVLTRWKYGLRKLRVVRAALSVLTASGTQSREEAANLMKEVSRGNLVLPGSPDAARVYRNFEANLKAVITTFREAEIPVIMSEVTSNLLFPPFVGDPANHVALDSTLRRLYAEGDDAELLQRLRSGADSTNPLVNYWAGRALLRRGDPVGAPRRYLVRARDNDLLRFRAPTEINAAIRRVARDTGTPLVAADSLFTAASEGGIPGDSLFWEHLHPTLKGYYLLAEGYVRTISGQGLIPGTPPRARLVPLDTDSLAIPWMELAYADLSIQHLTGRWPFENYRRVPAVLQDADPPLLQIVREVYDRRIPWNEGCYRAATYFWARGDLRRARTTYEGMLDEYPYSFYTNYLLGSLLSTSGERERAARYYRRSIESSPDYPNARLELGLLEVNLGNFDSAISLLEPLALREGARDDRTVTATACYGLGAAYANRGDISKAIRMLDRALVLRPGYADAERLRAEVRRAQRRQE